MGKNITFYLYATWHDLNFGSFCGNLHAGNNQFWDVRWSGAPMKNVIIYHDYFCILIVYLHIFEIQL